MDQTDALIQRQQELRDRTDDTRSSQSSENEQQLIDTLQDLANDQRAEAVENDRQAGLRSPVLETALARLKALLDAQQKLEEGAAQQLADKPDASRETAFEIGAIEQGQRELSGARGEQRDLEKLAQNANDLESAASESSEDRIRAAYDRLRARVEDGLRNDDVDAETRAALERDLAELRKAQPDGVDQESRDKLSAVAKSVGETARAAAKKAGEAADRTQRELADRTRKAAEATRKEGRDGEEPQDTATSRALQKAADSMDESIQASQEERSAQSLAKTTDALRKLAEARQNFRDANPSPGTRAGDMAASADQVARDLRNAPMSDAEERAAAEALDTARDALRSAEQQLEADESGTTDAQSSELSPRLAESRAGIEQAMQSLQGALEGVNEGRDDSLRQATARQEQLAQRAREAREQLDRARDQGDITPEQRDAAERSIQKAEGAMQRASENLQKGRQSDASRQQDKAADALEKAADGVENNRPLTEEERRDLQEIAKEQEELEKDIIRLAELTEERENEDATKALQRAAEASERAQQALQNGERQKAEEEQQEAQEQLEKAREELKQERDRYMDLRQEELLFQIGEELQQFLDTQRSLSEQTANAARVLEEKGRLSRPARRKLNQVGERENELIARTEFILQALVEEGVLVFSHALKANVSDLEEIAQRLAGRRPDPGEFTQMLQKDVEDRAEKLIEALRKERERREQERNQQGQQQGENQFANQREPLVPLIAELQMLRQMEEDMQVRTRQVERLIQAAGADGVTEFDLALAERLAHQHGALTGIFQQVKAAIEQAMQAGESEDPFGEPEDKEEGK